MLFAALLSTATMAQLSLWFQSLEIHILSSGLFFIFCCAQHRSQNLDKKIKSSVTKISEIQSNKLI